MTSTPVVFLLKRSGLSSDRPSGIILQGGEPALCFGASDPGLYFEDSAGAVRKIGPAHYGSTAPNSTPAGLAGNSVGEIWTDSSTTDYYLKVWTGSTWQKIGAAFADFATTANSASTAGTATIALTANTATLASGAVAASGAINASGAIFARTATLSSGAIAASGAVNASGALFANATFLASGSIQASGAVLASGAIKCTDIGVSGLPAANTYASGSLFYQIQSSGVFAAGLYVRAQDTWLHA